MTARMMAALLALGAVVPMQAASAQTAAVSFSGGRSYDGDGPWTLGYSFTATNAVSVAALGAFDFGQNGFASGHEVGLWDLNGTLLRSTSLASGTSGRLVDGFRYNNVAPLVLNAGQTYIVGASDFGTGDAYWLDATITPAAGISYAGGAYWSGSGLTMPTSVGDPGGYFGGNLLVGSAGAVPEPASWAMMIGGFGLVGGTLRRRVAKVSYAAA